MNRLDKIAYDRMIGLSNIQGTCLELRKLKVERILASCPAEELPGFVKMAKDSGRFLMEFGARLAARSGSGIADEEATSAARYLGHKGGRAGGRAGGQARMNALSERERRELGRKAAAARWAKAAAKVGSTRGGKGKRG